MNAFFYRPLDEGKKVKEKFDAIFSATMYIKTLDTIKKKRKEMMVGKCLSMRRKKVHVLSSGYSFLALAWVSCILCTECFPQTAGNM